MNNERLSMELTGVRHVIVGEGFFGSVIAERITNDLNENVVMIEKRDNVGEIQNLKNPMGYFLFNALMDKYNSLCFNFQ